jgi:hypothetical protein
VTFVLTARDSSMVEVAPIDGYLSLDFDLRLMAAGGSAGVGTVVVANDHPALTVLLTDSGQVIKRTGIVARREGSGVVVASGNLDTAQVQEWPGGRVTFNLIWDDAILSKEIAYATPTTDISSTGLTTLADGHDIRTGAAESVLIDYLAANVGPTAGVARRQFPWLVLPTTSGRGGSDTWKARDETLLDLCRRIAIPHGITFRLLQDPSGGGVALTIGEPTTDPVAQFSPESGSVTELILDIRARTVDEVIVAGPGTDVARVRTRRNTSVPAGELRSVQFIDARQASGTGTEIRDLMRQPADEALADGATVASATFKLVEQPGSRYGTDWALGDTISVASWRRTTVNAVVQSARIVHEAGHDPVISPFVGTPEDIGSITGLKALRRLLHPLLSE